MRALTAREARGAREYMEEHAFPEPNTGCWLWDGYGNSGYGVAVSYGRREQAHRMMWILTHGTIPKGKVVMHLCDMRECVNPKHLRLGTHADNMADMRAKGRQVGGPNQPHYRPSDWSEERWAWERKRRPLVRKYIRIYSESLGRYFAAQEYARNPPPEL